MQTTKKVFRSRISVLLIGFILALFIWVALNSPVESLYILGGTFVFIILTFTGARYIISGDKVYVRMWFIPFGSAKIADIISLERTYNPLSSPASSLKRLYIRHKQGLLIISPVREQEFIKELKAINPDIKVNVPDKKGIWRFWDWDI